MALVLPILASSPLYAAAEEELVSTMSLVAAVEDVGGIRIVPAPDVLGKRYTEDLAPSQVLEIIRPDQAPVTIGRLFSSCTCLRVSLPKRSFGPGERALLEVRNVKPTVAGGAKYAIFVQLTSPVKETLQYDLFIKSERQPTDPSVNQPPRTGQPTPSVAPGHAISPPQTRSVAPAHPRSEPAVRPPPHTYEDITPYRPRDPSSKNLSE